MIKTHVTYMYECDCCGKQEKTMVFPLDWYKVNGLDRQYALHRDYVGMNDCPDDYGRLEFCGDCGRLLHIMLDKLNIKHQYVYPQTHLTETIRPGNIYVENVR